MCALRKTASENIFQKQEQTKKQNFSVFQMLLSFEKIPRWRVAPLNPGCFPSRVHSLPADSTLHMLAFVIKNNN